MQVTLCNAEKIEVLGVYRMDKTGPRMGNDLGAKIKALRLEQNMTLKELGEKANLSVSYISMVERGRCHISLSSLQNIADALHVSRNTFFDVPHVTHNEITRSYEQKGFRLEGSYFIYQDLSGPIPTEERKLSPVVVTLLPGQERKNVVPYSHEGEEFCYVLEGVMTLFVEDRTYDLYPGDSMHIKSTVPHNWANLTNNLVKIINVSYQVHVFD